MEIVNKRKELGEWKKSKLNSLRKTNGITLISLVITIIVMLILAGVSISVITGNNSMLDSTITAVDLSREEIDEEQNRLNKVMEMYGEHMPLIPLDGPAEVDKNGLAVKNTLIKPDGNSNCK